MRIRTHEQSSIEGVVKGLMRSLRSRPKDLEVLLGTFQVSSAATGVGESRAKVDT
jgi:hypothetical protein